MKRKKSNLGKEEKDVLKKMSTAYLTKLVTKTNIKRPREASDEKSPPKKRKISKNIESLRRNTEIDDLYDDEINSNNLRNSIATRDVVKKEILVFDGELEDFKKHIKVSETTPVAFFGV